MKPLGPHTWAGRFSSWQEREGGERCQQLLFRKTHVHFPVFFFSLQDDKHIPPSRFPSTHTKRGKNFFPGNEWQPYAFLPVRSPGRFESLMNSAVCFLHRVISAAVREREGGLNNKTSRAATYITAASFGEHVLGKQSPHPEMLHDNRSIRRWWQSSDCVFLFGSLSPSAKYRRNRWGGQLDPKKEEDDVPFAQRNLLGTTHNGKRRCRVTNRRVKCRGLRQQTYNNKGILSAITSCLSRSSSWHRPLNSCSAPSPLHQKIRWI